MKGLGRPSGRASARRVWLAPAYVLHQYAYRDTSRIVEVFTGDQGDKVIEQLKERDPTPELDPFQALRSAS